MQKLLLPVAIILFATFHTAGQGKADISQGPVLSYTKKDQVPGNKFIGDYKLYLKEQVYLEKDDWLVTHAQNRDSRLYVMLFDKKNGKYLQVADDSLYQPPYWRCTLSYIIPRTDTFQVMIATELDWGDEEDYNPKIDTPKIDYTLAIYRPRLNNPTTSWNFTQRLSYLCNHWTAGFRAMPGEYQERPMKSGKPLREILPEDPVTVLDSMGASIQVLNSGKILAYFQYTADMPYSRAKTMYDKLLTQLKSATSKAEVKTFKDGMRRMNELATAYFSLKVPAGKVPIDYSFTDDAGAGYKYLPVNLFLFGTDKQAKVMVVMGEISSDIYDVGW